MSPWERRVEADADLVYEYMATVYRAGRRLPFSVVELERGTEIGRDRVYGALAVLVMIRNTVGVTDDRPERARFYPIAEARAAQQ